MPRGITPRTLATIVGHDPLLAQWQRRADRDQAILRVLRRVLPVALAHGIGVRDAGSAELALVTPSGAAAAVLRQRGPDLLPALAREGLEFTAIKVVVQPRPAVEKPKKSISFQWDNDATTAFSALRDRLPEGPLKEAVAQLLRRHR